MHSILHAQSPASYFDHVLAHRQYLGKKSNAMLQQTWSLTRE